MTSRLLLLLLPLTGCTHSPPPQSSQPPQNPTPSAVTTPTPPLPPGTVPTTLFQDPATGISFRYPTSWRRAPSPNGYLPTEIASGNGTTPLVTVRFLPAGAPFASTDLEQLTFTVFTSTAQTPSACTALLTATGADTLSGTATVNGVSFTEATGGDAAMSHRVQSVADATFHNGRCLLAERDLSTLAPGVKPDSRPLTPAEEGTLQAQLSAVFASLRLTP